LIFLFLGMVFSFVVCGLRAPYWNKALANIFYVHEALLYNDGSPQEFLWYPSYLVPQLLGLWYGVLHLVGLLPEYKLSLLPAAATEAAFDATWQKLVTWGYVQCFLIGCLYIFLSIALIRRLTGLWQVAVLAGIALAFSGGIALAYRNMRGSAELLSSALIFLALLLTLIAAREGPRPWRFVYLALAGLLVSLGLTEKVQALLPALTIPVIALAFGRNEAEIAAPTGSRAAWLRTLALCLLGLVLLVPAVELLELGIASMPGSHLYPVVPGGSPAFYNPLSANLSGVYQWILLSYVVLSMVLYAVIWRMRQADAVSAIVAVLIGLALGFLALYARYNLHAVIAVSNPIEQLHAVSGTQGHHAQMTSVLDLGARFAGGLGKALAIHTFFLSPSNRPTLLIEWLSIFAAVILWRRGQRQAAMQIAVLVLAAIAIDATFTLRAGMGSGVKIYYAPYPDPFLVLAGAVALSEFHSELLSRRAQTALIALMIVYVVWGHFEAARAAYGPHDKAKVCKLAAPFTKISVPFCQDRDYSSPGQSDL
jgi:hypothetical protein